MSCDLSSPPMDSSSHSSTNSAETFYSPRNWYSLDDWQVPTYKIETLTYLNVSLGEQFERGRYVIVRKLGYGSFSTVWLARDRKTNTFVSLKILSSEGTHNVADGKGDELEHVKRFIGFPGGDQEPMPEWQQHIGRYFETFIHRTEEKVDHLCLTMEPLAWDLYVLLHRTPEERMPEITCKSLVRQILIALEGIHREMGCMYVDLKPNNVLIRPEDILSIIADEMVTEPAVTHTSQPDRYPTGMIRCKSQPLPPWIGAGDHVGVVPLHAVLVDFGETQKSGQMLAEDVQNMAYRGPEVYLGYPCTGSLDIWSLGCLIFYMVSGGADLFRPIYGGIDTEDGTGWSLELQQLADMTDRLQVGIPTEMRTNSQYWDKYLDEKGDFLHDTAGDDLTIKGSMLMVEETRPPEQQLSEREVDGWNAFMLRCLKIKPESRATAAELLQDPWLRDD